MTGPNPAQPSLGANRTDLAAALARGVAGGIPVVGGLVAEVVNSVIPNQKIDRVVAFVELLAEQADRVETRQALLEARLKTPEGSDLLEEGIVQASRAVSAERRRQIANILVNGVTDRDLKYDRVRKLLAILESLTDSELVLLVYYSKLATMGSSWHQAMMARHPELLRPATREIGAPQAEVDRWALRDGYERTLVSQGLLEQSGSRFEITALGRLLLKYAEDSTADAATTAP